MNPIEQYSLVHATNVLPEDGILRAGAYIYDENGNHLGFGTQRKTVHLAINGLVPSHASGNWEDRKYAVIAPLKDYAEQLINLFPYDSFALGDVSLNKRCTWILPKDTPYKPQKGERVITYDPALTRIRSVIESVIEEKKGCKIKLYKAMGAYDSVATTDTDPTIDLCKPDYWQPILQQYPHLSFGPASHSLKGNASNFKDITIILEEIEMAFLFPQIRREIPMHREWSSKCSLLKAHLKALQGTPLEKYIPSFRKDIHHFTYLVELETKTHHTYKLSLHDLELGDFIREKIEKGEEENDWEVIEKAAAPKIEAGVFSQGHSYFSRTIVDLGEQYAALPEESFRPVEWRWGRLYSLARMDPKDEYLDYFDQLTSTLISKCHNPKELDSASCKLYSWIRGLKRKQTILPDKETAENIKWLEELESNLDRAKERFSLKL